MPARVLLRLPAPGFKPRIVLRSEPGHDVRKFGPGIVIRYGVMPDGVEVPLGRTVDENLSEAADNYWAWLFETTRLKRVPRFARWGVKRWWPVEVKGYEMTPLPPLKAS
jgi:hypothetical protein